MTVHDEEQKFYIQVWSVIIGPPIFILKVLASVWLLHWLGWLP
jgi:hypothetical protein